LFFTAKGEKLRDNQPPFTAPNSAGLSHAVYKRCLTQYVNWSAEFDASCEHVRSRIRQAARRGTGPATSPGRRHQGADCRTIRVAATAGVTDFGENYVQESFGQMDQLADLALRWHFYRRHSINKTVRSPNASMGDRSIRLSVAAPVGAASLHAPPLNLCIQVELVPDRIKAALLRPNWGTRGRSCQAAPGFACAG